MRSVAKARQLGESLVKDQAVDQVLLNRCIKELEKFAKQHQDWMPKRQSKLSIITTELMRRRKNLQSAS